MALYVSAISRGTLDMNRRMMRSRVHRISAIINEHIRKNTFNPSSASQPKKREVEKLEVAHHHETWTVLPRNPSPLRDALSRFPHQVCSDEDDGERDGAKKEQSCYLRHLGKAVEEVCVEYRRVYVIVPGAHGEIFSVAVQVGSSRAGV